MRRGILAIALLLALCGQAPAEPGSWRLEPPIPSLGNTNQIAKPEAERRKNGPASDPKVALPEADNPSAGTNKSEGFDYTSADWWVAAFTLLLAVIAVGQLIVFGMQARRLHQTVEAMKEAESRQSRDTKDLLAATKDAALAAKQFADVAEKTMALNDRPWIGFSVRLSSALTTTADVCTGRFVVLARNYGRRPAIRVVADHDACVGSTAAVASLFKLKQTASRLRVEGTPSFGATIFPDTDQKFPPYEFAISREEIEAARLKAKDGLVGLFLVVGISYGLPTGGEFSFTGFIHEVWIKGQGPESTRYDGSIGKYSAMQLNVTRSDVGETT